MADSIRLVQTVFICAQRKNNFRILQVTHWRNIPYPSIIPPVSFCTNVIPCETLHTLRAWSNVLILLSFKRWYHVLIVRLVIKGCRNSKVTRNKTRTYYLTKGYLVVKLNLDVSFKIRYFLRIVRYKKN